MSEESQERLAEQLKLWEADEVAAFTSRQPERLDSFSTNGGIPVKRVYTPLDVPESFADIGLTGQYAFTRGP